VKQVTVYTDGACSGNPGPGGHAAVLVYGGHHKVVSGRSPDTTNNVEELLAVLDGLRALKGACHVTIVTDSLNVGWLSPVWRNDAGIAMLCHDIEQAVKDAVICRSSSM
jgi:ribonuclease HI